MKEINYQRPWLYPKQEAAIFHDKRYGMIEASTKAGKTVGTMAWLLEKSIYGKPGQNRWWIAPVYPQAEIAYKRMKECMPKSYYEANETKMRLSLINGTHIWFKSGEKPDNLYGEDVYDAVMDEASRMREESFHAIRSTLTATRGQIRLIGNVKGRKNFFYNMSRRAEAGDPDMEYHKLTAYDAAEGGVITLAEIEDAKRTLPEQVFKELYLAEPSDDGGNPFGLSHIAACVGELSEQEPKAWGIDLAKSVDWTVLIGLDAKGGVCRFERFQKPWQETIAYIKKVVGTWTPALVDSTGVGDPILEALQRDSGNFEGYKFTSPSKQMLMEGLAVAIQERKTKYPDGIIRNELDTYEYEYTRTGVRYTAPVGLHDDCVCSLALAVRKLTQPGVGDNLLAYYDMIAAETAQQKTI